MTQAAEEQNYWMSGRSRRIERDVLVRRATVEDARVIAQLHIASWQATYPNELSAEYLAKQDLAPRTAAWRDQLEQGVQVLVAEERAQLIGFVACGPARDAGSPRQEEWEIYNLHVAPLHQGHGFGRALFDRGAQLGQEHGAGDLILWVVRSNASARAFYERNGMQHDGGQQEHGLASGQVLHEVRYRMKLSEVGV